MYNLRNDQSIVIKEADKGSAVVIWDKKDYLMESEKQLSYKELMKKFQVTDLFSLKLFIILLKKFEEEGTFLVIF